MLGMSKGIPVNVPCVGVLRLHVVECVVVVVVGGGGEKKQHCRFSRDLSLVMSF